MKFIGNIRINNIQGQLSAKTMLPSLPISHKGEDRSFNYISIQSQGKAGDVVETRISGLEKRMDKVEEKLDQHSIDQAETRVYVKEIYKKMDDIKASIASMSTRKEDKSDKDNDRWAKIVERAFWAVVATVAYFTGNGVGG